MLNILAMRVSGRIRLYGEEFEVVSDPFPEDDGIAVHVKTKSNSTIRVLQLPATVVQSVKGRRHESCLATRRCAGGSVFLG